MEEGVKDPLSIAKDASLLKDAQSDLGKLDVLLCGMCHSVFHFVEEFNSHKEGNECSESTLSKSCENEDKPIMWAFCLWKNKTEPNEDKSSPSWSTYQKWCKLPPEEKEVWIDCGKILLSLNKIRAAKMQEVKFKVKREEDKDPLTLSESDFGGFSAKDDKNNSMKGLSKTVKSNDKKDSNEELNEYVVEAILGKRFNARKKHWEYKVKWENWDESQCSWEPTAHLTGCKALIEQFEEKLKQEKERKKIPESMKIKSKTDVKTDEEDFSSGRRPQRSSKQKALNQVKRWLGESSDNDDGKRAHNDDDDDSDQSFEKRMKMEDDSDESYDDDEDRAKKRKLNGLGGKKIPHNVLIPDAQGIVRINQKQLPSLSSGVYIMSKTAGIIKLDSQTSKIAASGGQAVVKVAPRIGQTHIRIVKKDGATTNKIIQMSPKSKTSITPHKVTKVIRHTTSTPKLKNDEVKKMEEEKPDEESDSGLPELEFPSEIIPPEPEDPQADFTLDPTTGKIAGMEYPDPPPESETIEENKENSENTLDNIVKLAAADITEADLKPDQPELTEQEQEIIQAVEKNSKDELIKIRKDPSVTRIQQKFTITPNIKGSNILERTLQSPKTIVKTTHQGYARQVYAAKSPQRILNSSMTPKLTSPMGSSPMVRTVVRSPYSKQKQVFTKQKVYMSTPVSKYAEGGIVKQVYTSKPNVTKRVGNIGGTTIYKKTTPQQQQYQNRMQSVMGNKVMQKAPVMRKSTPIVRTVQHQIQQKPKPVISMPSLMDDDLPNQSLSDTQVVEAATPGTSADATTSETDLSSFTLNDSETPIFITGDDGTVYQVAGQNEQGQTILITQGPDGQQQCLLVTSENATQDETTVQAAATAAAGGESEITQELTNIESTSSENVEQTVQTAEEGSETKQVSVQEPLSVQTEQEASDQVVAQVIRTEPPSPGGTHKVVVMLPDGNLMVTQVTPEEYASLELDK